MKTSIHLSIIISLFFSLNLFAQSNINLIGNWDYSSTSRTYEKINKVIATSNGFLVAVGETISKDNKSLNGLFLVLNVKDGTTRLRRSIGGKGDEAFNSVVQNFDGTFTLVGYSETNVSGKKGWVYQIDIDGKMISHEQLYKTQKGDDEIKDVAVNSEGVVLAVGQRNTKRTSDVWVMRIDNKKITDRIIGRSNWGIVEGVVGGRDGSFIMVGSTRRENRTNPEDAWVMKIDKNGQDLWGGANYFGDKGFQEGLCITSVVEGGYAFVGATNSSTAGLSDKWLVKINEDGNKEWEKKYGGTSADVATAVIELSEGGFAVFGQTWSYLPGSNQSTLDMIITDKKGNELASDTYFIPKGGGDEVASALVELYTGDIVIAGISVPKKTKSIPKLALSAISYKGLDTRPKNKFDKDTYSSGLLSSAKFYDNNKNSNLETGERGYFVVEVSNNSNTNLRDVTGKVTSNNKSTKLEFWDEIKLGTIRAGQKKQLIVPVLAKTALPKGEYGLNISIESDGQFLTNSSATIESNQAAPAKFLVSGHFTPNENPTPNNTITLNLELRNVGGKASTPIDAYFRIPSGISSKDSEKIRIPTIRAQSSKKLSFSFTYGNSYSKRAIDIVFETKGRGLLSVLKTFSLDLGAPVAINRGGVAPDEMIWVSHDPDETGSRNFSVNKNELFIKVKTMSGRQLDKRNFKLLINGRKQQGSKMDGVELTPPDKDMGRYRQTYTNKVRLKEGANKIRIEYDFGDGTNFKSRELVFNYAHGKRPNLHVISIGVPYDNLKYTVKDAKDFANVYEGLKGQQSGFKHVDVNPFTSPLETTTNKIREVFERLSYKRNGIKKEDLLVIYLSTHGKVNRYGEFLLMPSDYKSEAENTYSINFENDILKPLKFVDCKKLVFIDACHSGSAFAGSKDWTNEDAASKVMNDLLKTAPGIEIIASCGDNEFSYEDDLWANSAFTKAIIEAFTNKKVKMDGRVVNADIISNTNEGVGSGSDGIISLKELKNFIQKRVPYLVKTTKVNPPTGQNPSNKRTGLLPEDMGIFYLKKY